MRSGGLFYCSGGWFLLTSFHFLLLFVTFLLFKVHCLLLFVTFFTPCNFHKLLFTVEKGQGIVLLHLFIVQGEGVCLDLFIF